MMKVLKHPATLLLVAFVAQLGLAVLGANDGHFPMGDVIYAYKPWLDSMLGGGRWLGINAFWVYPFPVLLPLLLANLIWPFSYLGGWLIIAIATNLAALSWLVLRDRRLVSLGWFWLAATLALGPVALSRVDGISIGVALFAVSALSRSSTRWATFWLTIAAWLKVWPIAIIAALWLAIRQRGRVALTAVGVSVVILAIGVMLGGNQELLSFVLAQNNRGIQIESVAAMPWMWQAAFGADASVYYDQVILTFQVSGDGTEFVGSLMSWLMLLSFGATAALGWLGSKRGRSMGELLSLLSLAFTLELIVFNKVGSPQYLGWLILPALIGLLYRAARWRFVLLAVLISSALTQLIYPVFYDELLTLQFVPLVLLTVRNLLEVALWVWAVVRLSKLVFEEQPQQVANHVVLD